jgi:hypothetical protein
MSLHVYVSQRPRYDNERVRTPGERSCRNCRGWYDRKLPACPECESEPSAANPWLQTVEKNNHLAQTAQSASPRSDYQNMYRRYKSGLDRFAREQ